MFLAWLPHCVLFPACRWSHRGVDCWHHCSHCTVHRGMLLLLPTATAHYSAQHSCLLPASYVSSVPTASDVCAAELPIRPAIRIDAKQPGEAIKVDHPRWKITLMQTV